MNSESIKAEVVELFEDVMDLDESGITETTTADDIEEWDSLSHVRFIVAIERHFGVKFSNSEIESLKQLGDIIQLIGDKKSV